MECNIMAYDRKAIKKPCYKTKYKNIVIVKLENRCYSITHYPTGMAIDYERYTSVNKALLDLDDKVNSVKECLKNNNITLKQFCRQHKIKKINFKK